jgi:hypothetical protein
LVTLALSSAFGKQGAINAPNLGVACPTPRMAEGCGGRFAPPRPNRLTTCALMARLAVDDRLSSVLRHLRRLPADHTLLVGDKPRPAPILELSFEIDTGRYSGEGALAAAKAAIAMTRRHGWFGPPTAGGLTGTANRDARHADGAAGSCQARKSAQEVVGMAQDNTLARSLHDLGLAAWFGGSLMGAVGLNGAAAVVDQPDQRLRVANAGWARWTPVNLAGIAAHLAGGAVLLAGNKGRLAAQRGVASATIAKAAVTGLALAATAWSRALGERLIQARDAPVEGGTTPTDDTPPDLAGAQRQLTVLQWVIPGLTGAALVLNALMGEQQRPQQVTSGLLQGLRSRLPVVALAGTGLLVRARSRRKPTAEARTTQASSA